MSFQREYELDVGTLQKRFMNEAALDLACLCAHRDAGRAITRSSISTSTKADVWVCMTCLRGRQYTIVTAVETMEEGKWLATEVNSRSPDTPESPSADGYNEKHIDFTLEVAITTAFTWDMLRCPKEEMDKWHGVADNKCPWICLMIDL